MATGTETRTVEELQREIISFLKMKDTGALATSGVDTRVSPVRYFLGEDLEIFIYTDGGAKFDNLKENDEVCLLVSTEFYGDYKTIKGVQIFGRAEYGDFKSFFYDQAKEYCPFSSVDNYGNVIKINPQKAIYKDALDGEGEKEVWYK